MQPAHHILPEIEMIHVPDATFGSPLKDSDLLKLTDSDLKDVTIQRIDIASSVTVDKMPKLRNPDRDEFLMTSPCNLASESDTYERMLESSSTRSNQIPMTKSNNLCSMNHWTPHKLLPVKRLKPADQPIRGVPLASVCPPNLFTLSQSPVEARIMSAPSLYTILDAIDAVYASSEGDDSSDVSMNSGSDSQRSFGTDSATSHLAPAVLPYPFADQSRTVQNKPFDRGLLPASKKVSPPIDKVSGCAGKSESWSDGSATSCFQCGTEKTSLWRRVRGERVCNACALYEKLHGHARPVHLRNQEVRKRRRLTAQMRLAERAWTKSNSDSSSSAMAAAGISR